MHQTCRRYNPQARAAYFDLSVTPLRNLALRSSSGSCSCYSGVPPEKTLQNIQGQLQGYPHFEKRIVFGDPIQEILKTIETEDIDMVIMGTHGRKGLEHVFFGSVAENIVKKSPAPVLTINPYKAK